ncbi:MAG: AI-2E family transporter [Bacteroidales bacterium]
MDSFERKPFTFDRVIRIIISLLIIFGLLWFINRLSSVLITFFVGWLIAYMLNPFVEFIQFKLRVKNRVASIFIALVLVIAVIVGGIAALIPPVTAEINKMTDLLHNYPGSAGYIPFIPTDLQDFISEKVNLAECIKYMNKEDWEKLIQDLFPKVMSIFSSSLSWLFGLFASSITLLYVFFILLDYDKISKGFINILPERYRSDVSGLMDNLEYSMNSYFRGQATVAFFVGILFAIGFNIIGLPLATLLGLFIGLLNMVPYLQTLGVIPTAMLCIIKSAETGSSFWGLFAAAIAVFGIVQIIQDGFLTPKIMGKITGLNPAIILLSLSIWGSLMGIVGMIIALPMTTLIIFYYERYILNIDKKPIRNSQNEAKKQK